MTVFETLSLALPVITALCVLVVGIAVVRRDKRRDEERALLAAQLRDMHGDIKHVDECVDDLKERVLGNTVSKADLAAHEADVRATIEQTSQRIGLDTNGLHQRIFRVENHMFKIASSD